MALPAMMPSTPSTLRPVPSARAPRHGPEHCAALHTEEVKAGGCHSHPLRTSVLKPVLDARSSSRNAAVKDHCHAVRAR